MQVLIDTNTDSPAEMRALAAILLQSAADAATPEPQMGVEGKKLAGITPILEIKADTPPPPPPPPPPTPAVPVAAAIAITDAAGTASSTGADALTDSAGVKWNHLLHTSTKTKDIDGKWKPRKSREAPVPLHPRTVTTGTTPPPPPPPVTMINSPVAGPILAETPPPPPPPTVMVPSADDEPDAPIESGSPGGPEMVSTGASAGIDFATFIVQITTALNGGEITQARINEVQKQFGLLNLFSLNDAESAKLQDVAKAFGFVS